MTALLHNRTGIIYEKAGRFFISEKVQTVCYKDSADMGIKY